MFEKLEDVVKRFDLLNQKLSDPAIYDNQKEFKAISSEKSAIKDIVEAYKEYKKICSDIEGSK